MAHAKTGNPNQFILPDLGEGVHEAELIRWRVGVGDRVAEHDILAEMETDKALVEVPSPRAGVISALHGSEGEVLKVGNVLVEYEGDADEPAVAVQTRAELSAQAAEAVEVEPEREDAGTVVGQVGGDLAGVTPAEGKALATPAVRRLARDLGVDINAARGTGIGGRVTEKDVRSAASGGARPATQRPGAAPPHRAEAPRGHEPPAQRQAAPPPAPRQAAPRLEIPAPADPGATGIPSPNQQVALAPGADTAKVPFRGVRRTIAGRLRQSVDTAVHFTVMDEADVTELDSLRKKLGAASGEKVSFLPFVCAAVCRALTEQFGVLNATVDDAAEEITQHRPVHLGIATDTESGLMVPVIRDADRLGVLEIGRHIGAIASGARSRTLTREQLMGSTFTISNVGSYAGRFATPVINYPEVGILAAGRVREGMVVGKGGWFRVGKLLPLSLACDHRVVDGATGALCLARIVELLQEPAQLLAPARG
ncbi:MAG TPA: dihydrolipoamide acetyltransferase family protein [Phycisphaerales bacterium]|nr:dihydrolipoamide acetyltransferase family protein [Phycisphaerales bacterium]